MARHFTPSINLQKQRYTTGDTVIQADDGNICYNVGTWGKDCHFYMNENGVITMMYKGKNTGSREMMKGNKLSEL